MSDEDALCKYCSGPIALVNPTGHCNHVYWPDNLTNEAKEANGYRLRMIPKWVKVDDPVYRVTDYQKRCMLELLHRSERGILIQVSSPGQKAFWEPLEALKMVQMDSAVYSGNEEIHGCFISLTDAGRQLLRDWKKTT